MTLALAFLAGVLSILNPCVLPILPIVVGTAVSEHRFGPVALAAGLLTSFIALGLFIATIGFSIGLDAALFSMIGAGLLTAIGVVLMLPPLQARFTLALGPATGWLDARAGTMTGQGLAGQFGVGALLGAVWAPCSGPTLGAAALLASQGRDLGQVASTMLVFGLGASVPLLGLGLASRSLLGRWREKLLAAGNAGKLALGLILFTTGILILTGAEKVLAAKLVQILPQWLIELTTRY
jgi:cytochrome c-type biogenesis protein